MNYLSNDFKDLIKIAEKNKYKFKNASPFPHIVFDNFFNEDFLNTILYEFPDLSVTKLSRRFKNHNESKLASNRGDFLFSDTTKNFLRFLNSHVFIDFLQEISSIKEPLIPDPHFIGGGLHEIKKGGFLNIHSDFYKHYETGLDRRINMLIYLNKNWDIKYGGALQLWKNNPETCEKKIMPFFNRVVIFNTNDYSLHGHPEALNCPENMSRKSIALYYYSNGRPNSDLKGYDLENNTFFIGSKNGFFWRKTLKNLLPPFITKSIKKLLNIKII